MFFAEFAPNLYTRGDEFSLPPPNLSLNLRLMLIFPSHLRLKQDKRKTLFSAKKSAIKHKIIEVKMLKNISEKYT